VYGKIAQALAGAALLGFSGRMLHRVSRAAERKDITRIVAAVAAVVLAYCATGAASVVTYAHRNRGRMAVEDVAWLRRQLAAYGPVPVARLFGPAFAAYVAQPPLSRQGATVGEMRAAQLERALDRWPDSMWADGVAFALASQKELTDPAASAEAYWHVADRYGRSPFAPRALARLTRSEPPPEVSPPERLRAARRLLADHPRTPEVERAAEVFRDHASGDAKPAELEAAALAASEVGQRHRKPEWLLTAAQAQERQGRADQAAATARKSREEAVRLRAAYTIRRDENLDLYPHLSRLDGVRDAADAFLDRLAPGR
jgi:hypothetical protein